MPEIINARLDKRNFEHLVKQMHDNAIDPKPVLAAIGNLAVKSITKNFIDGGRPNAWAKSKKTKGKTMIGTGFLYTHIHYTVDNEGTTIATPPTKYAAILHFGGKTRPHEIRAKKRKALHFLGIFRKKVNHPGSDIPARPYMILQDEDIQAMEKMMVLHITGNTLGR